MKTIVLICFLLFCVAIVCATPVPQRGDWNNGFYYPSFLFSRTSYNRFNRYRNARQLLENLKRRSSTASYAEIGSAWGR
ncbi:hypothetical protein KPH14_009154 [Odynerus spinipes]|uniref:Uncharacterized protein n=1 Tax=Odynerus spinipes TaxID=1348599 RepID=A0AAD9VQM1_9HYME|nr:hypothetical protein KPH14_009154 [Odynerus spinipes]